MATNAPSLEALRAEANCRAACTLFFHHLDRRDYTHVAELIAEDGVWLRGSNPLLGPNAVLAALEQRSPRFVTRHLLCNVLVTLADEGRAAVAYELMVISQDGNAPCRTDVLTGEDRLELRNGSWRFVLKQARKVDGLNP